MATIVDSLIITLGLDPTQFAQGKKQALQDFIDLKEAADRAGKGAGEGANKASAFFSKLRGQVLMLFAAFAGGRSLKQFTDELTRSNAEIGRMANFLGATTQQLSAVQGMTQSMGGTAAGANQSLNALNMQLQQIALTGESSVIPYFRALGISLADSNGRFKTAQQLLPEIHRSFQGMEAARAQAIGHSIGLSDDLINILIKSDKEFNKFMEDQQRWGLVTKEQAKAAQELQYSQTGLSRSFETLGRMVMTTITPALIKFNEWLTKVFEWFQSHPHILIGAFTAIAAAVTALGVALAAPIFTAIGGILAGIGAALGVGITAAAGLAAAFVAVAAGLVLLYDDWKTWMDGGKSLFGDFYQYVADKWHEMLGWLDHGWKETWDGLSNAVLDAGPKVMAAVKKTVGEAFQWAINLANKVWQALTGSKLIGGENEEAKADAQAHATGGVIGGGVLAAAGAVSKPADAKQYQEDISYLMKKHDLTREQAAALVSQEVAESTGNERAVGDNGHAYGLFQHHEDRRAYFHRLYGHPMEEGTRQEQLDFAVAELKTTEQRRNRGFWAGGDAATLAAGLSRNFERPADAEGQAQYRSAIARALMKPPDNKPDATNPGAAMVAGNNAQSTTNNQNSTVNTTIGTMNINTQATDAQGIAKDIRPALKGESYTGQVNYNYL